MVNTILPYTSSNFISSPDKCSQLTDILDISHIINLFKLFGTDVLFMQDKYYGPTIPYSSVMLAQDNVEDSAPKNSSTIITVFRTNAISIAFSYIASVLDLKILSQTEASIMNASSTFKTSSQILDTVSLYCPLGEFTIDTLIDYLEQIKPTIDISEDVYWGNKFGYTLAPVFPILNGKIFETIIKASFEYADV